MSLSEAESPRPLSVDDAPMLAVPEAPRSLVERLAQLRSLVIELGALTCEAITAGTSAFLAADLRGADAVIRADRHINELRHRIEDNIYFLLAREHPVASDLRRVVTVLRITHELERSGDLMTNVAKATHRLFPLQLPARMRGIIDQMGTQAHKQTLLAMEAFADDDPSWAGRLIEMDNVMDDLTRSLFTEIFAHGAQNALDEGGVQRAVHLALVGRHYERIADHAVTVAERVEFAVTGRHPEQ